MKFPKYPIIASKDLLKYQFYSEGPMGKIRKDIVYEKIANNLFNLAFGDWNQDLQKVDDSKRSNNGDREKVLSTVAFTIMCFFDNFPKAKILIEGSTSSRTRLYQIGITNNLMEISDNYTVKGFINGRWEKFRKGINYNAFLIKRKLFSNFTK